MPLSALGGAAVQIYDRYLATVIDDQGRPTGTVLVHGFAPHNNEDTPADLVFTPLPTWMKDPRWSWKINQWAEAKQYLWLAKAMLLAAAFLLGLIFCSLGHAQISGTPVNAGALQGYPITTTAPTNGQFLKYVSATNLWTPAAGGGSSTWDAITDPAGNLSLNMAAYTTVLSWSGAQGAAISFRLTEAAGTTGTGPKFQVDTVSGSNELPVKFTAGGTSNGVQMSAAGDLAPIGTGTIGGLTSTIFGYLDPTSSVQTQLNAKQATLSTSAAVASQFITAFTAPDTFSRAQPATADLSDASNIPLLNASNAFTGTNSFSKDLTFSGTLSPTALVGDVNDYNPTNCATSLALRIDGGAADRNVTGLQCAAAAPADGRIVTITNIGATNSLVLKHESASSTAANRFSFAASSDTTLAIGKTIALRYDGTSSRWRFWGQTVTESDLFAASSCTGVQRGNGSAFSCAELSGDVTTSGSNAASLAVDSVSADELNATGVEAELEAVLDLAELQGAVTDPQVPDTITLTNITQITTRSHTSLSDIGSNTHADIDTHIGATEAHGATGAVMGTTNTQAPTNKTIDSGIATTTHAAGANFVQIIRHATDCTAITDGKDGELCWEQDANTIYVCEPTAGGCDTAGEWVQYTVAGDGVGYDQIQEEASNLTKRPTVNMVGVDVTCVDNAGASKSDCTVIPVAESYDATGWNGDTGAANKDDVRDKLEAMPQTAGDGLTLTGTDIDCDVSSTTVTGCVELAIASEVNTGTDATRAITPDALAGSVLGQSEVQLEAIPSATTITVGDGKAYFHIATASKLIGMNLIGVVAAVETAVSSSGAITVDIARCAAVATGNPCSGTVADVLSTNLTIDANEDSSDTAATAAVIDGTVDDVIADQTWRVDVDGAGTGAAGLLVTLIFQLP